MDDLEIEEQLKRIKKRDLFQTYFYKMACRAFGPPKFRDRVIIAPPMPTLNSVQTPPNQMATHNCHALSMDMKSGERGRTEGMPMTTTPGSDVVNYHDWVNQRRAFRKDFDNIGNLSKWLYNKPMVTELEMLVVERERKTGRTPSPQVPRFSPSDTHVNASRAREGRSPRYHRTYELRPLELDKCMERHCTGNISREDQRAVFEKDGIPVVLESSLGDTEGDTVTVNDTEAWSHEREGRACQSPPERGGRALDWDSGLERGAAGEVPARPRAAEQRPGLTVSTPVWSRGPRRGLAGRRGARLLSPPGPGLHLRTPLTLEEQEEQAVIQLQRRSRKKEGVPDEEVLAIMRTVRMGDPTQDAHSRPSSLGGATGRAVERFRRQCLGEYLDTLDQCRAQGLRVNQAALQRVLLHPGDHVLGGPECPVLRQAGSCPLPGCGGRLRGVTGWNGAAAPREEKGEEEDGLEEETATHKVREETRLYPLRRSVRWGPRMTLSTGRSAVRHKTECWLTGGEDGHMTRNTRATSCRHANPNAFWPGLEAHVRLYLPEVGPAPEGVLFQHIVRSPAPSPGSWPLNHSGYATSGDIDGHKAYCL